MMDFCEFKKQYHDIECCRTPNNDVFILIGGLGREDPESYLIKASEDLMDGTPYSQYVEEYLDNPWTRVLITSKDGFSVEKREGYVVYSQDLPGTPILSETCRISILVGGLGRVNPNSYMNAMVDDFIGTNGHNTYIESNLKNPWVRVVITGINELNYE